MTDLTVLLFPTYTPNYLLEIHLRVKNSGCIRITCLDNGLKVFHEGGLSKSYSIIEGKSSVF